MTQAAAYDVDIRLATPAQLPEIGRITGAAYVADGFMTETDSYVQVLADAARRSTEAELWVAVDGDVVLGSVTYAPVGSAYREIGRDDEGEFRMLAVSPAARGRGVGQALVEKCLERSRELGYAGVRISSMDRMTSAHRIYERLGFTRSPADDWRPEPHVLLLGFVLRF